jgi:hypothetical protein
MGHFAPKPYGAAHARAREIMSRGSSNTVAARITDRCLIIVISHSSSQHCRIPVLDEFSLCT